MGATLCCWDRIFGQVALRRWVNGTGRFDRTRWLKLKGSRGPLKFLDWRLDQSGRRHYIPSKCRELFTQWRSVISQETRIVKTQPSNARKHKSWGRRWWRPGQLRFWIVTNHGTAGVTDKFTPEYTSVVLQVKTSYQLQKWFRDDVLTYTTFERYKHMHDTFALLTLHDRSYEGGTHQLLVVAVYNRYSRLCID
jgi:hypothetical protein